MSGFLCAFGSVLHGWLGYFDRRHWFGDLIRLRLREVGGFVGEGHW
jgi:hypothetical protein